MEALPHHGYLEFHHDTLEVVRREVGLHRPGEMADAVRILDDWVKQQKHFLKKNIDPVYLETLIVMSKGSLERAKCVLDKMCTARTLAPRYFDPYDVAKEYQIIKGTSFILSLPKLTEEYYRLMVWKFNGRFPPRIVEGVYKFVFSSLEYHKRWDYFAGGVLIYDLSQVDLGHIITTLDLVELKNVYMIILEGYGARIKRIHIITASKLVYTVINFFKQFLTKKIVDRLMVHESWEVLQQYYPRHILPKDYGGTERSLEELREDFLSRLSSAECQEYLKELSEMRVDEAHRPVSSADDVISSGTFRVLNID
ncbi:alpha-tocopherol transfer protein-like [Aricia agestis]|uniref:alpha-tocopherol transfer protein-like n=1 Tax=Aricia agestis TaxID=91739 RepID=UPI001C20B8CE|nr:alpha-tocopherol transfer protein-like [Aricia agestis]XP_041983494.1 alpha-tocopherol transfer protein-like [Aricia agestis]